MRPTDDITFVQWDEKYIFGGGDQPGLYTSPGIEFTKYYNNKVDEWQLKNLW